MPSRSLQRLPPRSLPRSPERKAPCRARRLAGRAGSRHGHPLLTRRNIPLEPALPASGRKTTGQKSGRLPRPPHYAESGALGRCQAPDHPDSCRICPYPRASPVCHPGDPTLAHGAHTGTSTRSEGAAGAGHPAARETAQHRSFGSYDCEFIPNGPGFHAPARLGAHTGRAADGIRAWSAWRTAS
jgi:hypothetical protein